MPARKREERIIGFWKGAVRAVIICPICSRFISTLKADRFKKLLLSRRKPKSMRLNCPRCHERGFVYLEQPWERIWRVMERGRQLVRFDGWRKRSFLLNIADLYSKDSWAYRNILQLRKLGFRCGRRGGDPC